MLGSVKWKPKELYAFSWCMQDKVNNLITLSKLEQVDLKYQQNLYRIMEH